MDTLCQQLAQRSHTRPVYAQALASLRERGFLEEPDEAPRVTAAGRRCRDQVEADTDRYFYAPWGCLDEIARQKHGKNAESTIIPRFSVCVRGSACPGRFPPALDHPFASSCAVHSWPGLRSVR